MNSTKSGGNVFLDIGFDEIQAEELAAKADLISMIGLAIKRRGLTQNEAAAICGTHQSSLSKILSGKLDSVTLDQLAKWFVALGGSVDISVSPPTAARDQKRGTLRLRAAI